MCDFVSSVSHGLVWLKLTALRTKHPFCKEVWSLIDPPRCISYCLFGASWWLRAYWAKM
jgi:hypothetical protein